MGPKARVAVRLKDAVSGGKSQNRSVDLDALSERFTLMKKKLVMLVNALRRHHTLIVEMSKSRTSVSRFYSHCVPAQSHFVKEMILGNTSHDRKQSVLMDLLSWMLSLSACGLLRTDCIMLCPSPIISRLLLFIFCCNSGGSSNLSTHGEHSIAQLWGCAGEQGCILFRHPSAFGGQGQQLRRQVQSICGELCRRVGQGRYG